jgi:hypothetical protein
MRIFFFLTLFFAAAAFAQAPDAEAPAAETAAEETAAAVPPPHGVEESLAALRPLLIGQRYLEQMRKRLAVQLARMDRGDADFNAWFTDNALIAREFAADVRIIYVLDFAEGAQLVSHGMMKSWGMDLDRLHQRALVNLDRAHGEIAIKQVAKLPWLYVIETGDGYAASRALLHWRWAEMTLKYGNTLILGMPTRDVVVFTPTLNPERIEQLRETVDTVERHQGQPVSRRLFQWTPQGWIEFDAALQQTEEQGRQSGEEQGGGEGEVVDAATEAHADVAGQPADAQQGGQPRQAKTGDEHRDQQGDQPLQHERETSEEEQ